GPSSSGDWKAGARCRALGRATAALLGLLLASVGSLTGTALAIVPVAFAILLAIVGCVWFGKCHPRPSRWLRVLAAALGLGAGILALLALVGASPPQLVPLLCVLAVLLAGTLFIGLGR